jgi:hypothetical protein
MHGDKSTNKKPNRKAIRKIFFAETKTNQKEMPQFLQIPEERTVDWGCLCEKCWQV